MRLTHSMDALRGRLVRLKAQRGSYLDIAAEVGLSYATLQAFARGECVTQRSLEKIERWCDTQEAQVPHANG